MKVRQFEKGHMCERSRLYLDHSEQRNVTIGDVNLLPNFF